MGLRFICRQGMCLYESAQLQRPADAPGQPASGHGLSRGARQQLHKPAQLHSAAPTHWLLPAWMKMHVCVHRHGASGLQTHQASLPVIVEYAEGSGSDYQSPPSCSALRPLIYESPEVVLHLQTLLMAVNDDGDGIGQDHTGPTDDGYISIALASTPQDPYCCKGPSILNNV